MWTLDLKLDDWYRMPFAKLPTSFVIPTEISYRSVSPPLSPFCVCGCMCCVRVRVRAYVRAFV